MVGIFMFHVYILWGICRIRGGQEKEQFFSCRDSYKAVMHSYCLMYLIFQTVPVKAIIHNIFLKMTRKILFKGGGYYDGVL